MKEESNLFRAVKLHESHTIKRMHKAAMSVVNIHGSQGGRLNLRSGNKIWHSLFEVVALPNS
jgi:hypothetical protein